MNDNYAAQLKGLGYWPDGTPRARKDESTDVDDAKESEQLSKSEKMFLYELLCLSDWTCAGLAHSIIKKLNLKEI